MKLLQDCNIKMKPDEKSSMPRVRIAVIGNTNVGKSGKNYFVLAFFHLFFFGFCSGVYKILLQGVHCAHKFI